MAPTFGRLVVAGAVVYLTLLVVTSAAYSAYSFAAKHPRHPPNGHKPATEAERANTPKHPLNLHRTRQRATLPTAFDARQQWPQCTSLTTIRDQGGCGTCWAVSSAAVMSDRLCIATNGAINDFVSGWQTAGCSNLPSTDGNANCQAGGNAANAFLRAALYGMNSGGEYNSNVGCVPYQVTYSDPLPAIDCKTACSNPSFTSPSFPVDDTNHFIDSTWASYLQPGSDGTTIAPTDLANQVILMKTEILNYGSIDVAIDANDDFANWQYVQNGAPAPYDAPDGGGHMVTTDHAVRLLGWAVTAAGVEYWIGANSWGTSWQDQGFFYVTTGKNTIGIEGEVSAAVVNANAVYSCSSATFCTQPIDSAVQMDYTNSSAPLYLFQGNCLQQVQVSGSKLVKVGSAVPIIKQFVAGVNPPVTTWSLFDAPNDPSLINTAGAALNCQITPGTTKYQCSGGTASTPISGYTIISSTQDIRIANDGNIYSGTPGGGYYQWALSPANFFTGNGMATVTGLLKLSATQVLVFGKSSSGSAVTGLVNISGIKQGYGQFTWVTKPTTPSTFLAC